LINNIHAENSTNVDGANVDEDETPSDESAEEHEQLKQQVRDLLKQSAIQVASIDSKAQIRTAASNLDITA